MMVRVAHVGKQFYAHGRRGFVYCGYCDEWLCWRARGRHRRGEHCGRMMWVKAATGAVNHLHDAFTSMLAAKVATAAEPTT